MKINEHKYFADPSFSLNATDAPYAIGENQIVNGENIRTITTDGGNSAQLQSIGSNILLSEPQPSVVFITIGSVDDPVKNRILKFQYNTTGTEDKIICLDQDTNIEYDVLLSSQVIGGLNFSKDFPIHSARIQNGLLYWVNNSQNEPRRINYEAAIKGNNPDFNTEVLPYTYPVTQSVISWIRRQPGQPLQIQKGYDSSVHINQIAAFAFLFFYRYVYRDFEISTISSYSSLSNFNKVGENFNYVSLSVPLSEMIDQDVLMLDMGYIDLQSNKYFIVKTWDRRIANEEAAMEAHNTGTALTYKFFNSTTSFALDAAYSVKPFDSVPIYSNAMEIASNRAFLLKNVIGYNTPLITSLSLSLIDYEAPGVSGTAAGKWYYISFTNVDRGFMDGYIIFISNPPNLDDWGYYWYGRVTPPFADPISFTDIDYMGANTTDVMEYMASGDPSNTQDDYYAQGSVSTITDMPSSTTPVLGTFMKSDSYYKAGVTFYDNYGRKTPIITDDSLSILIPDRSYSTLNNISGLQWTLSNTNAINEIPVEAVYFSVDLTLNLRTRSFLQGFVQPVVAGSPNITYISKDLDNKNVYNTKTYNANLLGIAIDISSLNANSEGYIYAQGDIIKIYLASTAIVYYLQLTGQDGQYVLTALQDLGTLADNTTGTVNAIFEIYTPYKISTQEPFFERGVINKISNSGTSSRVYSITTGQFNGDVYVAPTLSGLFLVEAMSPNNKYFQFWFTDAGRPNYIIPLGQSITGNTISYSNVFIPGTNNNGLSTFDALDTKDIPFQCGAVSKLIITGKVQGQQGVIMLAICVSQTASLYLGEVQLVGSTGNAYVAQATDVIGTINILKKDRGTTNPEAVTEYKGNVYWPDVSSHKWVQYSINGLDDINYDAERYWNLWFLKFLSTNAEEIESLGCRPFIFTTVDTHHEELIVSIPSLSNEPPNGYLPDYPDMIYPFDILDYQAKAVVYKLGSAGRLPHWQGSFTFYAENFITLRNKLYSFHNGLTYLHNDLNSQNNFYGVQYTSKVMVVANIEGELIKVYNNLSVQSNIVPLFVYMYCNYPYQQSSDLVDYDFRNLEGVWNATIYRNKLVPTFDGYTTDGLLTGEKMRNTAMFIMLEFNATTKPLGLISVTIGCEISRGNDNQIVK